MLNTIRENAKWFVAVPIVCFGALIFVDWGMSPGNSMTQQNIVGKVDGEKLSFEVFSREVEAISKQMTEQGQELEPIQYAEIRDNVFKKWTRIKLNEQDFATYGFEGSALEVLENLKNNPPPGADKAPIFMGPDSQFSRQKYLQWLATPKVFDDPYMQALERELSTSTIPDRQLMHVLAATQPISDLEVRFRARLDKSSIWATIVTSHPDSFAVVPEKVTETEMKAWFDANPDSLWHPKQSAVAPYITLEKAPSKDDSQAVMVQLDTILKMARSGESFEELARNYSEDPGSAKMGGDLGGYQSLKKWVPEFGAAARTLDSGKISDPVKSQFGWHIILSKGRKIENGDTLYALSHILVTLQTSPETVDSLKNVAEEFRKVVKAGASFSEAAKKFKLKIDSTPAIVENTRPQLASGFVPGLVSYLFNGDESVSEVLENRAAVHVFGKGLLAKPGRNYRIDRETIRSKVAAEKAVGSAAKWLESIRPAAATCDTSKACLNALGKVYAQTFDSRPLSSFVEGFSYGAPDLVRMFSTAKSKQWTAPTKGKSTAVMVMVDSLKAPSDSVVEKMVQDSRSVFLRLRSRGLTQKWAEWRLSLAKVENRLDRYFKD